MVETHLAKEELIQIPGYKIFRNDGPANSTGISIAIKEKLKTIVAEVNTEHEIDQTLQVLLNNWKTQARMGVIYGPQEIITPHSELNKLHESISDQIDTGKENNQQPEKQTNHHKGREALEKIGKKRKHLHSKW